jgi:ubiquinone biosynthesis protein UbiJ
VASAGEITVKMSLEAEQFFADCDRMEQRIDELIAKFKELQEVKRSRIGELDG